MYTESIFTSTVITSIKRCYTHLFTLGICSTFSMGWTIFFIFASWTVTVTITNVFLIYANSILRYKVIYKDILLKNQSYFGIVEFLCIGQENWPISQWTSHSSSSSPLLQSATPSQIQDFCKKNKFFYKKKSLTHPYIYFLDTLIYIFWDALTQTYYLKKMASIGRSAFEIDIIK